MPRITPAQMRSNWSGEIVVCPGCGANLARVEAGDVEHRPDCSVSPSPLVCAGEDCDAIRLPSEPKTAVWFYDARTREYLCPTHHPKGTP